MTQQAAVFLTGVVLARELGPDGFGTVGLLKNLSTVILLMAPLGLDLALLKHASVFRDRPGELRTLSRALRALVALINLSVLIATATVLGPWLQDVYSQDSRFSYYCVLTMIGVAFAADLQISWSLFRVANRVSEFSFAFLYFQPLFRLVASLTLLKLGYGLEAMIWVTSLSYGITFLIVERLSGGAPRTATHGADFNLGRSMIGTLSESVWMAASLMIYQMMRYADVLVLGLYVPASVTGQYIAASSVAQIIQIYPAALSQSLGPRIADLYRSGATGEIGDALQRYVRLAAILGGYLFAGVAIFGTDLDLVFGPGFQFSLRLTALLALGWFVSATLAPFGYALSMTGRHRSELIILVAGSATLLVCLFLFVPRLLDIGAALSVLISFVVVNIVRCAAVIRLIGDNPLRARLLLPPAAFLCAAYLSHDWIGRIAERSFGALLAACVLYSLAAFLLWLAFFASPAERASLRSRISRGGPGR